MEKSFFIAYLGNIYFDTRSLNLINSLKEKSNSISAVGFEWRDHSKINTKQKEIKIYSLSKKKSSLFFYLKFVFILLIELLSSKANYFFAMDLYTLPFVVIVAKLKKGIVIYDARELFGFLAGLVEKDKIQSILRFIEKKFIGKASIVIATGEMDAEFLAKEYSLSNIVVLRNLPKYNKNFTQIDFRTELKIPGNKLILIYQGIVLHGRGLKIIFDALQNLKDKFHVVIVGDGEQLDFYKSLAESMKLSECVTFVGRIEQDKLLNYTSSADVGLSLIENVSLSYYYALPNKLFEYIMAEVPLLSSNLPQMQKIVENYSVGFVYDLEKNNLNELLLKIYNEKEKLKELKINCAKASRELNWENEITNLLKLLN